MSFRKPQAQPAKAVHTAIMRGQGGDRIYDRTQKPGYRQEYVTLNESTVLDILFEIHSELTKHDTDIKICLSNWSVVKEFVSIMMEHYEADPKHAETLVLFKDLIDDIKDLIKDQMGEL